MRIHLPNVLSEDEARSLASRGRSSDFSDPVMGRLVNLIQKHAPVVAGPPSYWSSECKPCGHGPHYDGALLEEDGALGPNHMSWCQYSAVSLLTDPASFSGGEFSFHDPDEAHKDDLRGSLVIYSSGVTNDPQKHSAAPHDGGTRTMLLMFFATE